MTAPHLADPRTELVALHGGPQHHRWFHYRDWLARRDASRRGRYHLGHACAAERRYLPTDHLTTHPDPALTDRHGPARVWIYIDLNQWWRWGREYRTPEETGAHHDLPLHPHHQAAPTGGLIGRTTS
ncbi:hypothetical protein ACFV4N_15885 [Actinosynnema sp. NPDC059797]